MVAAQRSITDHVGVGVLDDPYPKSYQRAVREAGPYNAQSYVGA